MILPADYIHSYLQITFILTCRLHSFLPTDFIHSYKQITFILTRRLHSFLPADYIHSYLQIIFILIYRLNPLVSADYIHSYLQIKSIHTCRLHIFLPSDSIHSPADYIHSYLQITFIFTCRLQPIIPGYFTEYYNYFLLESCIYFFPVNCIYLSRAWLKYDKTVSFDKRVPRTDWVIIWLTTLWQHPLPLPRLPGFPAKTNTMIASVKLNLHKGETTSNWGVFPLDAWCFHLRRCLPLLKVSSS